MALANHLSLCSEVKPSKETGRLKPSAVNYEDDFQSRIHLRQKQDGLIGHFDPLKTFGTVVGGPAARPTFPMNTQGYGMQIHNVFSKPDPWSRPLAAPPSPA